MYANNMNISIIMKRYYINYNRLEEVYVNAPWRHKTQDTRHKKQDTRHKTLSAQLCLCPPRWPLRVRLWRWWPGQAKAACCGVGGRGRRRQRAAALVTGAGEGSVRGHAGRWSECEKDKGGFVLLAFKALHNNEPMQRILSIMI